MRTPALFCAITCLCREVEGQCEVLDSVPEEIILSRPPWIQLHRASIHAFNNLTIIMPFLCFARGQAAVPGKK